MRFTPQQQQQQRQAAQHQSRSSSSSSLTMFLGSDGGVLGVGTPELITILLVGYFVLGPSDLYKLTKEIGKAVQNFRTLSTEATKSFETSMEGQLQVEEIRKAQRDLNDAFSFRRSINVDQEEEAFTTTVLSEKVGTEVGAEPIVKPSEADGGVNGGGKKKKIRRRKKQVVVVEEEEVAPVVEEAFKFDENFEGNVPDLDMTSAFDDFPSSMDDEAELLRAERMERLMSGSGTTTEEKEEDEPRYDWEDSAESQADSERFAAQLNNWNDKIMANEDALSPLAMVMERLALLEEEQQAQTFRLEEEYRERAQMEEKFYKQKRALLEDTAAEVQALAYENNNTVEESK